MSEKWILLVDDEESVLAVLQKSLKKLGENYRVVGASDGMSAMVMLRQNPFDLIVTDYKMRGMTGLELIEEIRLVQPNARVILMTAYGTEAIESEARRLGAYRYLVKPLEIDTFRQIVQEALEGIAVCQPGTLILSDQSYRKINLSLDKLQGEIGARCIFLADSEGHFIARVGNTGDLPLEHIACLVGGSIVSLLEAGRVIDGDFDSINLAYHEGKQESFYILNVGKQLLLIIVLDRNPFSSRLGSVWFCARHTAQTIQETLKEVETLTPLKALPIDLESSIDTNIDKMFKYPFEFPTE